MDSCSTIVILGKGTVGKTSLIYRFINNMCPKEHDPTLEEIYTISITTGNGEQREFKILDTAGEEDYNNMIDEWINNANGFILVFAINDEEGFETVKKYVERINKKKNKIEGLPLILVGNKCDLENERKVSKEDAINYAKMLGTEYYETSALTDQNGNCKTVFQECAFKIINSSNKNEKSESKCLKCSIF